MHKLKLNVLKTRMLLYFLSSVFCIFGILYWFLNHYQEELHGQLTAQNQVLIVFDFDGTLCDSMDIMINTYNDWSQIYHTKPIDKTQTVKMRDIPIKTFLQTHGVNAWKLPIMKYQLAKALAPHVPNMSSFQGIRETLISLKNRGYTLGILTSNSYNNVDLFLKNENLAFFDFIYCGSSLFGKARLLKKINRLAKPSKMYYVGDENRDIEAAHQANIISVAVTWGYQSEFLLSQYNPSYLARTMNDLLQIFQN